MFPYRPRDYPLKYRVKSIAAGLGKKRSGKRMDFLVVVLGADEISPAKVVRTNNVVVHVIRYTLPQLFLLPATARLTVLSGRPL
jgi:hypothetical protein